jgi:hypothetical protein
MMKCNRKRRRRGKDLLKCFHCGGNVDGCLQEDLWWLMIETDDKILICQKCIDEFNAKKLAGESPRLSLDYAPHGLIEYLATKHGVEEIPW